MKKIFLLVMAVLITASVMADPKDNFKKSGVYIGGSVRGSYDSDDIFLKEDGRKGTYTRLAINPYLGLFVDDNISIQPRLSLSTFSSSRYNWDSTTGEYEAEKSSYGGTVIGAGFSFMYYITNVSEIIPYIGAGVYVDRYFGKDELENGETVEVDYVHQYGSVSVEGGSLYFLTDHVAINLNVDVNFSNTEVITWHDGQKAEYDDDYNFIDYVDVDTSFYVGISYFFPTSESRLLVSDM